MRSEQLEAIAQEIAAATAQGVSHPQLQPLARYLDEVRKVLWMDMAFVSQFVGDRRVFALVSAAGDDPPVAPGQSHPLLDTYCKRIVDGTLPRLIADVSAVPEAARLPITHELQIGCYLSAPIVLSDGTAFGLLCCFSHAMRPDLRQSDVDALEAVGRAIAASVDRHGGLTSNLTFG